MRLNRGERKERGERPGLVLDFPLRSPRPLRFNNVVVGGRVKSRAVTLVELLIASLLLGMVAIGAAATWGFSSRIPALKRGTEMGVYLGVKEIEKYKAAKFLGYAETTGGPNITYYDKVGTKVNAAVVQGYKVKSWVTIMIDRDGKVNTEDLREIRVEVRSADEASLYVQERTLITLGGL